MKLNLVADYTVPGTGGKRHVVTLCIDGSANLMGLIDMATLNFPTDLGEFEKVRPKTLTMCESGKKAEAVATSWRSNYKSDGRLWDYSPIDAYQAYKESEEGSEVLG